MVSHSLRRSAAAISVAAALIVALAACTAPSDKLPTPAPSASASSSAAPSDAPDPVLVPAGDADANLPYFTFVIQGLLATVPTPNGQQIVENLVAAGFVKADMEITPDVTVGKEAAEAIQFSVRINGSCLIGQTGGAGFNAISGPLLGTGKCLVGKTRTIDF